MVLATQPYVDHKVDTVKVSLEARIIEGLNGISKEDIVADIIKNMADRIDTLGEEIKNWKNLELKPYKGVLNMNKDSWIALIIASIITLI